jgi:REP element-mobilizing transposase RayT
VRLYLFCLMSNHIHLVVETPRANLGRFMHRLQTAYTICCRVAMGPRWSRGTPTSCG